MTRPQSVEHLDAHDYEPPAEQEGTGTQYTSTISAVGEKGRNIYIYLFASDTLEFKGLPPGDGVTSYMRVEVDMNGHRHWNVHLAPSDSLETGRLLPPPPPPPPGGGG